MVAAHSASAQDSSAANISGLVPPAELKRFEPFLGKYSAKVDWPSSNLFWEGSFELASTIKGWYVESNLIKESAGPHRHWRLVMTWDRRQQKYRVWRFETNTPRPEIEGVVKFEGDKEWYAVWENFPVAGGKTVTQYSRFRLRGADELEIITESVDATGKRESSGVVYCKRKR
jgi:hypothetical protein